MEIYLLIGEITKLLPYIKPCPPIPFLYQFTPIPAFPIHPSKSNPAFTLSHLLQSQAKAIPACRTITII